MKRKPTLPNQSKVIFLKNYYKPYLKFIIMSFFFIFGAVFFYLLNLSSSQTSTPSVTYTAFVQQSILIESISTGTNTPINSTPTISVSPTIEQYTLPEIGDFLACLTPCNGSNSTSSFPEKTTKIYAQWSYKNIPYGASYVRSWSMDNIEWVRYECSWSGKTTGVDTVTLTEPMGLKSGVWKVNISINGETLLDEKIEVKGNWQYWDPAGVFRQCYGKTN